MRIQIDLKQTTQLLAMFGGEPATIALMQGDGHSGNGLYAFYTDLPEEGAEFLGEADDEAVPEQQPATPEMTACSLGCATECIAQLHGCTSECPALPARPPFGVATPEHVAQRDEILAWLRKEAEKEDYFGHKFNAEKLDGAANLIEQTITAPSVPNDGRPYVLALSDSEVKALADFHDFQQEEADVTGAGTQGDAVRAKELRTMLAASQAQKGGA